MRVKRRDEHTVTDDRCISLFSFPSPRRPAVRRGNEVRPPACHLGSWNEEREGEGGAGVADGGLDGSGEKGGDERTAAFIPLRTSCMTTRGLPPSPSVSLPLSLSLSLCSSILRSCIYVRVDAAPRTRAHHERDKWLLRSFAAFSPRGEEYRHPLWDGDFPPSPSMRDFLK